MLRITNSLFVIFALIRYSFPMTKSKVFFILCLSFIAGIALHSFFFPDKRLFEPFTWYGVFLAVTAVGIVLIVNSKFQITNHKQNSNSKFKISNVWNFLGIWCLGFGILFLGFFRYAQAIPTIDDQHILHYI